MSDFFALEAGEYLDRLDALLQPPPPRRPRSWYGWRARCAQRADGEPAGDRARGDGARGAPRARGEGRRPWDAATTQIAIRAVE